MIMNNEGAVKNGQSWQQDEERQNINTMRYILETNIRKANR